MRLQDALYIKRTCPNCIKKFYPGDCRIISTTTKGKVLAAAPTGWKQILARINPVPLNRDYVLELASRECPHCHYYLPVNIERVENISIAVVGDTFSGKSHYIAALIHQMRQGEIQRIDQFTRFDCLTQGIESEYIRDVMKPLFEDKQSPPPTQMSTDPHRPPLIYEFIMTPSPELPTRHINLIFYDPSGEDLAIKERMITFSRYVLNADAIIFLVDPTSIDQIFNLLPAFLQKRAATGRTPSAVLNSIIHLLESYRGHEAGSRLSSIPIAVALAKSDLLKQLTSGPKPWTFFKRVIYNGAINMQEIDVIDAEVKQLLKDFGEYTLLQSTARFSKSKFFAISATGHAPGQNGLYPAIDPCRCLDPILWILYQLGIVQVFDTA